MDTDKGEVLGGGFLKLNKFWVVPFQARKEKFRDKTREKKKKRGEMQKKLFIGSSHE